MAFPCKLDGYASIDPRTTSARDPLSWAAPRIRTHRHLTVEETGPRSVLNGRGEREGASAGLQRTDAVGRGAARGRATGLGALARRGVGHGRPLERSARAGAKTGRPRGSYLAAELRRTCTAGPPRRSTHTWVRSFTRLTRAWRRRRRSPIERSSLSTVLSSSSVASSCQRGCVRLDVIRSRSPSQRSINPGDLNEPPLNTNTGNGKKFQTRTTAKRYNDIL